MDSKDRRRADRRYNAQKVAAKRRKNYDKGTDTQVDAGYFRDCNKACGCHMCKPWKWGLEPELKPSERRKVKDEDCE